MNESQKAKTDLEHYIDMRMAAQADAVKLVADHFRSEVRHLEELRRDVRELERWQSKAIGVALVLMPLSGIIGAAIVRLWK
jgi:hypothetical protein